MRVLIIEDEPPARSHLISLLHQVRPDISVVGELESVSATLDWLSTHTVPDLLFVDIHLADSLSFEIFAQHPIDAPVVFTTAYDQYALKAFEVNSIDYLLKPIEKAALQQAMEKWDRRQMSTLPSILINQIRQEMQAPRYKERFLIRSGQQLRHLPTESIACFFAEDGLVFARSNDKKKHPIDQSLEQLQQSLDPRSFFRINRKYLIQVDSIRKIHPYFNSRLKLELEPSTPEDIIVSRDRVADFKAWLDS
jgi:two-component system response regulator LytT